MRPRLKVASAVTPLATTLRIAVSTTLTIRLPFKALSADASAPNLRKRAHAAQRMRLESCPGDPRLIEQSYQAFFDRICRRNRNTRCSWAGSTTIEGRWRRGWDSNPRYGV